jgi:aspartyl-tRNA(Asn)/glutamyl-tRNA(Gln) amidotransferase subunit A
MEDITKYTIRSIHEGLIKKTFSAREMVDALFAHIEEKDGDIHAYLSLHADAAREQAKGVDEKIANKADISPLEGVPLAVKDNILIKGTKTTSASRILEEYVAAYDSPVIEHLRERGSIFVGKTNLDEFAMGSSTENSAYGVTRNPHDITRVAGGSSGGSAASVAAGMAVAALGSDTGGSIRQPSAFCGTVGLKPTYGAVSRYGLIAMASSLDQIGPVTKTVDDAALLFKEIAFNTSTHDATSVKHAYGEELLSMDEKDIAKLTVGVPDEYFVEGLDNEIAREIEGVIAELKRKGVKIKKISLPHTKYALSTYYIVMPAEVSTNLSRFDGIRYAERKGGKDLWDIYYTTKGEGFGPETKRRLILGTFVLSAGHYDAYYAKAQKVRTLIARDFDEAFKEVDVILSPATPGLPFRIGEKVSDPLQMYLSDIFTIPANLAGIPAISIPVKGREGKLPIGFQLMGKKWHEADILGMGRLYERI